MEVYFDEEYNLYVAPKELELDFPAPEWDQNADYPEEGEGFLRQQLHLATALRGPKHPLTRDCLLEPSEWHVNERQWEQAEEICRSGMEISIEMEREVGHPNKTLRLAENLTLALRELGRYREATMVSRIHGLGDLESDPMSGQIRLVDRIVATLVKSYFMNGETREFVPEGCLNKIVTRDFVIKELEGYDGHGLERDTDPDFDALVAFTHEKAIKIFSIAACSGLEGMILFLAMDMLRKYSLVDEILSIKSWDEHHEFWSLFDQKLDGKHIWTKTRISSFYGMQWKFLAPVFTTASEEQISSYQLTKRHILPFISRRDDTDARYFGNSFRYQIHPNHLKDSENPGRTWTAPVTVERLSWPGDKRGMPRQIYSSKVVSALQEVSSLRHTHIARFITAFCHDGPEDGDFYPMFEASDDGSLFDLWNKWEKPKLTAALVKDVVQQVLGLSKGLYAIHHSQTGAIQIHGNLTPENILRFKGESDDLLGTFKMTALKSSRRLELPTLEDIPITRPAREGHLNRQYEAPEEVLGEDTSERNDYLTPDPKVDFYVYHKTYSEFSDVCSTTRFLS